MSVMQINLNDNDITVHSKNTHSQPPKEEHPIKEEKKPEDKKKSQLGNLFGMKK